MLPGTTWLSFFLFRLGYRAWEKQDGKPCWCGRVDAERRPVTTTDEDDHASVDRPGLWWQVKEQKGL
jgi:hypothetical protein